jgi:hypothetical protein
MVSVRVKVKIRITVRVKVEVEVRTSLGFSDEVNTHLFPVSRDETRRKPI